MGESDALALAPGFAWRSVVGGRGGGGDACGAGATMQSATAGRPGRDGLAGGACGSERGAVSGPEMHRALTGRRV